jgi:hypothetical protein
MRPPARSISYPHLPRRRAELLCKGGRAADPVIYSAGGAGGAWHGVVARGLHGGGLARCALEVGGMHTRDPAVARGVIPADVCRDMRLACEGSGDTDTKRPACAVWIPLPSSLPVCAPNIRIGSLPVAANPAPLRCWGRVVLWR